MQHRNVKTATYTLTEPPCLHCQHYDSKESAVRDSSVAHAKLTGPMHFISSMKNAGQMQSNSPAHKFTRELRSIKNIHRELRICLGKFL